MIPSSVDFPAPFGPAMATTPDLAKANVASRNP